MAHKTVANRERKSEQQKEKKQIILRYDSIVIVSITITSNINIAYCSTMGTKGFNCGEQKNIGYKKKSRVTDAIIMLQ